MQISSRCKIRIFGKILKLVIVVSWERNTMIFVEEIYGVFLTLFFDILQNFKRIINVLSYTFYYNIFAWCFDGTKSAKHNISSMLKQEA